MLHQHTSDYGRLHRYQYGNVAVHCTVAVLMNHIHANSHLCQKMVVYLCLLRRGELCTQKGDSHFEQHSNMNENWCSLVVSKKTDFQFTLCYYYYYYYYFD
jgi:hypothetical protein